MWWWGKWFMAVVVEEKREVKVEGWVEWWWSKGQ